MNKHQQKLIEKIPDSNTEWVAQVMINDLKPSERHQIAWAIRKLNKILYKGWAKDMTLRELVEAVEMLNPPKTN
jgi:hypothetical protein